MNAADGTELTNLTPTGKIDVASGVSWRSQPYETLEVTKVVPADTSKGVERTANVRSYFSEAMNTATINETTLKLYRRCAGAGSYIFLLPPR